jgi:outer membrane protein assembly factor BamB
MKRFCVLYIVLVLALGACASDPSKLRSFSQDWADDQGKSISAVRARLRSAAPSPVTNLVVSVVGTNKIVGTPLGEGAPWSATHALDARPVLAGSVVILSGGGKLTALEASTGKPLWSRSNGGGELLGAGDDGAVTAVTLAKATGSTLLVVDRLGKVKHETDAETRLGIPAVKGGVVFVPWSGQYVSAIDGVTGDEIGRVTLRDKASRALILGDELFFGELSLVRFDDNIGRASRAQASRFSLPARELPGRPHWYPSGLERTPVAATARDEDRLFARPAKGQEALGLDSDRFYANYYRLAFGFDGARGDFGWVHTHESPIVGGDAVLGGVLLCDAQGKLSVLDGKTGQVSFERSVGEPIRSCVVQADSFVAPRASAGARPLVEQLADAVTLADPTLASAQRLLLRELTKNASESVTKTLLDVAMDPHAATVLASDARLAIATRRSGGTHLLAALSKRYDFLHDVLVSPPVGPIADALAAMKEPKSASLLAAQLFEPHVTDDDVRRVAAALSVIATEKETAQLRSFFSMYRASASSEELARAVGSVAEALLRLEPKTSRPMIEQAASDAMTTPEVRARLEAALEPKPPTAPPAKR